MSGRTWTPEMKKIVLENYKTKFAADIATEINSLFGSNHSKNAVIGCARRLGLIANCPPNQRRQRGRGRTHGSNGHWGSHTTLGEVIHLENVPPGIGVNIIELEPHHCRAVIGRGSDDLPRYCGSRRVPAVDPLGRQILVMGEPVWASSWCLHHRILYTRKGK